MLTARRADLNNDERSQQVANKQANRAPNKVPNKPAGNAAVPDAVKFHRLRRFNLIMGALHLIQGILMLVLSSAFALPVYSSFLVFNASTQKLVPTPEIMFNLRLGPMMAAFLFLSALAHFLISAPGIYPWYVRNLKQHINKARWIEYSFSSSLMIVAIAMLVGIYDIATLIVIAFVNASMILFGWMMELHNQTTQKTELDGVHLRVHRRGRTLDRHRRLPVRLGQRRRPRTPRVRLLDLLLALRVLQHLRHQPGAPVQEGRALARLPLRRARVHHPQPGGQEPPRLAGVRRNVEADVDRPDPSRRVKENKRGVRIVTTGTRGLWVRVLVSLLVVAGTMAAGCGTKTSSLSGTDWRLVTLAGQPALAEFPVTMSFDQKGGISGSSGVNRYVGTYKVDGKTLTVSSPLAGTLMAGPEPAMNQEKSFLDALAATKAHSVSGDTLTLSDGSKVELATFAKSVPAALQGTPWSASSYNNGKGGVVGLATDSTVTALFGSDGTLSGNASVNTYTATYTTDKDKITIGPNIATTKMAGPPALMEQETLYLAALARATTLTLSADTLELRSADGALQVLFRSK